MYDLLFNLDTLDLLEFSVVFHTSDTSRLLLPVMLRDEWKEGITKSIRTLK